MKDTAETFGVYRLYQELGRGGMAIVHLARREGAVEPCVLKMLHDGTELDGDSRDRLRREAQLTIHFNHRNLAGIIDAGEVDGRFYIAFEHVSGQSLAKVMTRMAKRQTWMSPRVAIRVGLEILAGLSHAHDQADADGRPLDLVHRDLTPANVMLGYDGVVKVIDFGIALARVDNLRTEPGRMLGTIRYMSPEQATRSPIDRRSDLFSVGTLLYEMLAARRAVRGADLEEMLADITQGTPEPLDVVSPHLTPGIVAVVNRALEKDPDHRYQTATEFRDALYEASLEAYTPATESELSDLLREHFRKEAEELATRLASFGLSSALSSEQLQPTRVTPTDDLGSGASLPDTELHEDVLAATTLDTSEASIERPDSVTKPLVEAVARKESFAEATVLLPQEEDFEPGFETPADTRSAIRPLPAQRPTRKLRWWYALPFVAAGGVVLLLATVKPPSKTIRRRSIPAEAASPPKVDVTPKKLEPRVVPRPAPPQRDEVVELLFALRERPKSNKRLRALAAAIRVEAADLPEAKRRRVEARVQRALKGGGLEAMERAVAQLRRTSRPKR